MIKKGLEVVSDFKEAEPKANADSTELWQVTMSGWIRLITDHTELLWGGPGCAAFTELVQSLTQDRTVSSREVDLRCSWVTESWSVWLVDLVTGCPGDLMILLPVSVVLHTSVGDLFHGILERALHWLLVFFSRQTNGPGFLWCNLDMSFVLNLICP